MCELLAMSARFPTTLRLSLGELARHGGGTGPHRDGWGVAYVQEGDALIVREPGAAHESRHLAFLRDHDPRSAIVLAHVRRATQGPRLLRNSQPFAREIGGRVHLFVHNGMLSGIDSDARLRPQRFRPVGDTDSERAFCALAERMARLWDRTTPTIDDRLAEVVAFAAILRELGPANFIYTDGDVVFAHSHRRRGDDGAIRPPGLHLLCRRCAAQADGVGAVADQDVVLIASVPLSGERWEPLNEGEVVALRDGSVISRRDGTRSTHRAEPAGSTPAA